MPNWCEGNIRLRGSANNIIAFLKNELEFSGTIPAMFEVKTLEPVYSDDGYEFDVHFPDGTRELLWKTFYISDTRRNFIDGPRINFYYEKKDDDSEKILCIDGFSAAWGIEAEPYVEKSKKYGIDIKIIGYEKGMMFRQEVEIVNGVLVKNEEREWKKVNNWYWEAEFPNLGG